MPLTFYKKPALVVYVTCGDPDLATTRKIVLAAIEAGADVTFVEAPETLDEVRRIPSLLRVPQIINLVAGGKTPIVPASELASMGYAIVLYANAALQGAIAGMQTALGELKARGMIDEGSGKIATFAERQKLVQKPLFDELEKKYSSE